jgi:hypothetical protein
MRSFSLKKVWIMETKKIVVIYPIIEIGIVIVAAMIVAMGGFMVFGALPALSLAVFVLSFWLSTKKMSWKGVGMWASALLIAFVALSFVLLSRPGTHTNTFSDLWFALTGVNIIARIRQRHD